MDYKLVEGIDIKYIFLMKRYFNIYILIKDYLIPVYIKLSCTCLCYTFAMLFLK